MVKSISVGEYITARMNAAGKTNAQIAADLGYPPQNVSFISMLRTGKAKLPVNKVVLMAKALNEDPAFLLRMVLREYSPETAKVIEEVLESKAGALTIGEWAIVAALRHEAGTFPVTLNDTEMNHVREVFKVAAKRK